MKLRKYITEEKDAKSEIMAFLKDNPSPKDEKIHSLADKLSIDPHEFEGMIYSILGSFLGNGRAKEKGVTEKDVDANELKMGIKVEMEHTDDPIMASRIAIDHLAEIDDYYTRLKKMEGEAGIKESVNEEKEETHVCKKCGWKWTGTAEEWKKWKGPCPECGAPKSQFT